MLLHGRTSFRKLLDQSCPRKVRLFAIPSSAMAAQVPLFCQTSKSKKPRSQSQKSDLTVSQPEFVTNIALIAAL